MRYANDTSLKGARLTMRCAGVPVHERHMPPGLCSRAAALVAGSLAVLAFAGSAAAQPQSPQEPLPAPPSTIESAPRSEASAPPSPEAPPGERVQTPEAPAPTAQAQTPAAPAPRARTQVPAPAAPRRAQTPEPSQPSRAAHANPAQPAADVATDDSGADEAVTELERARRELAEARRNLEAAARDVARLSRQSVGPMVQEFRRVWLGTGQRATLGIAITDAENGAAVSAVSPGGPAAEAGVRVGDVILAIDGTPVSNAGDSPSSVIIARLSEIEPGAPVELRLRANGDTRSVRVMTRPRGDLVEAREAPVFRFEGFEGLRDVFRSSARWSDMELVSLTPQLGAYFGTDRGLLVVRAPENDALMLLEGDVILAIGGREPSSPEHAMRILASYEPGETLELSIMRQREPQTLRVELPTDEAGRRARGPRSRPGE